MKLFLPSLLLATASCRGSTAMGTVSPPSNAAAASFPLQGEPSSTKRRDRRSNNEKRRQRPNTSATTRLRDVAADSDLGNRILRHATLAEPTKKTTTSRALEGDDDNAAAVDYSYVSGYAIKFQGCHHISQWNDDADDEDEVRIVTKRLVRFRLCPIGSCSEVKSTGCTSKYGDYVVDLNTFVYYYLQAQADEREYQCEKVAAACENECDDNADDADGCMYNCYANYGLVSCADFGNGDDAAQGDDANNNYDDRFSASSSSDDFSALTYAKCAQWGADGDGDAAEDENERRLEDGDDDANAAYYVGPYCAEQGGEIHLGLFTDNSCSTFASNQKSLFYSLAGYDLPYGSSSSTSLVPSSCMSCKQPSEDEYDDQNDQQDDAYEEEYYVKEICSNIYSASGKCESKMNVDYPNQSACTYIEGIKIIREDGVIRTSTTRKSKAAAVCIGVFTTLAVLLFAYVYYLRTKLGRAKINLSPPGAQLT